MNALKSHRILIPFILGLTTAGLSLAGDTSDNGTDTALAQIKYALPSTSAVVLSLHEPSGDMSRLVRVPGVGWTYTGKATASGHDGAAKLRNVSSVSTPTQAPLSVFIDGPTGYTFAYTQDGGWKFVGVVDAAGDGSLQSSRNP